MRLVYSIMVAVRHPPYNANESTKENDKKANHSKSMGEYYYIESFGLWKTEMASAKWKEPLKLNLK